MGSSIRDFMCACAKRGWVQQHQAIFWPVYECSPSPDSIRPDPTWGGLVLSSDPSHLDISHLGSGLVLSCVPLPVWQNNSIRPGSIVKPRAFYACFLVSNVVLTSWCGGSGPTSWCGASGLTSWCGASGLTSWCGHKTCRVRSHRCRNGFLHWKMGSIAHLVFRQVSKVTV